APPWKGGGGRGGGRGGVNTQRIKMPPTRLAPLATLPRERGRDASSRRLDRAVLIVDVAAIPPPRGRDQLYLLKTATRTEDDRTRQEAHLQGRGPKGARPHPCSPYT